MVHEVCANMRRKFERFMRMCFISYLIKEMKKASERAAEFES